VVADALAGAELLFEAELEDVSLELPPQDANKNKQASAINNAGILFVIICFPGQNSVDEFTIFCQRKRLYCSVLNGSKLTRKTNYYQDFEGSIKLK